MSNICFYFQVHQPPRLRRYSVFDAASDYFDEPRNRQIMHRVAHKCYLPVTKLLRQLAEKHQGRFRFAVSLTGCVIEQFQQYEPDVLEAFRALAETGCCEFLGETYYHSLAYLYSAAEFREQIDLHAEVIDDLFGQRPTVFRNTELVYDNALASMIANLNRYQGIIAEGVDHLLDGRSANHVYAPSEGSPISLLLKNYRLSDDIAFRFSDHNWAQHPLTAEKYAGWIDTLGDDSETCNLFMDIETFGEHQWEETGVFAFLRQLPEELLKAGHVFHTPTETIELLDVHGVYDAPAITSWADTERDVSAWVGNAMQSSALQELYRMEPAVKKCGDMDILSDWRRLTCSDHFYYMCTKYFSDGDVHQYFNPYESPYDSYINFMNVLDNLRARLEPSQVS